MSQARATGEDVLPAQDQTVANDSDMGAITEKKEAGLFKTRETEPSIAAGNRLADLNDHCQAISRNTSIRASSNLHLAAVESAASRFFSHAICAFFTSLKPSAGSRNRRAW